MSLNKVLLIGNVGKDPEVRYIDAQSGQGRKVASLTLATSERYKDRGGEMREITEWHNLVAWGQSADFIEKYVKKGSQVYVEGRIRTRSWNDQSGNKRYTTEINIDSLQLLGRRESSDQNYGQYSNQVQAPVVPPPAPVQPPVQAPSPAPVNFNDDSDDLPF